jgi:hypothetical protein
MSDPALAEDDRARLVKQLSTARAALRTTSGATDAARKAARRRVDDAKVGLGERGPVWWTDGAPDYNRRMAVDTPYREWFEAIPG